MGKRLSFHPVGLYIIRGALERSGYGVSRLRQIGLSPDQRHAKYTTEITYKPTHVSKFEPKEMQADMNGSFAADIAITKIWSTKSMKLMCEIETWIDGNPEIQMSLPGVPTPIVAAQDGFVKVGKTRKARTDAR